MVDGGRRKMPVPYSDWKFEITSRIGIYRSALIYLMTYYLSLLVQIRRRTRGIRSLVIFLLTYNF